MAVRVASGNCLLRKRINCSSSWDFAATTVRSRRGATSVTDATTAATRQQGQQQRQSDNVTTSSRGEDPDLATAKPFSEVPGFKGIVGQLKVAKDFLPFGRFANRETIRFSDVFLERFRQFGPIYRLDIVTGRQMVFVSDPEDIRKVFAREGRHPHRIMLESLGKYRRDNPDKYSSAGILVENGEKWHQARSKFQVPMLRPQIVETYIPNMAAVSDDFVERMRTLRDDKREIPDFLNELYKWALESIGLVAFNTRLGCLSPTLPPDSEAQRMIRAVSDALSNITDLEFGLQLWRLYPTDSYKNMTRAQDYIRSVAVKYCNETLERIVTTGNKETSSESSAANDDDDDGGGILGSLIRKKDLDQREVFTFMIDLLEAGIDTTSHSLGFLLFHLATNPDAQQKVFEEVTRVLPSPGDPVTANTLKEIPYLRACIKESMRLLSVVDGTSRVLDHDVALSGYRIPAKALILLVSQSAALLEENYEEPTKFKPERWLDRENKPHPYSNLPFGHGPRMCIGRRVALQEIQLLVIKIIRNFRVEYEYDEIRRVTRFINMPDQPLRFAFVDRQK